MINKKISSLLFSFCLVAASFWFFFPAHDATPLIPNTVMLPDAYMEDVTALIMDKEGNLNLKLTSPRLVHFNRDDATTLSEPKIVLYQQSPAPWFISANVAEATFGLDNVHFKENVVINHAMDSKVPETTIKTLSLLVHTNTKIAETRDLITLLQPNLRIQSHGMFANMETGDIKLLSQPRGEYVPDSSKL